MSQLHEDETRDREKTWMKAIVSTSEIFILRTICVMQFEERKDPLLNTKNVCIIPFYSSSLLRMFFCKQFTPLQGEGEMVLLAT